MKTPHTLLALAVGFTPLLVAAETPSWCISSGLGISERAICVDPTLGLLDQRLNAAYAQATSVEEDLDQERWLANRDACGADIACLEYSYRGRIAELGAIAGSGGNHLPRYGYGGGGDEITVSPIPEHPRHDAGIAEAGPLRELLPPGGEPDPASEMLPILDDMTPRPWCASSRLNPTEQTICASRDLSRFDALLELVYGRATASDADLAQLNWLRSQRDACGTDSHCVMMAYTERIEDLNRLYAREIARRHDVYVPAGQLPPPGMCRVWYPERPPGLQPPPTGCDVAAPPGAILIRG